MRRNCLRLFYGITVLSALTVISVLAVYQFRMGENPLMMKNVVYHNYEINSKTPADTLTEKSLIIEEPEFGCKYPIAVLITSEFRYCLGSMVLYGSIIRTTITENVASKSICMNFMYVNASMSLSEMRRWKKRVNPFANIEVCNKLFNIELNNVVPLNWYAVTKLDLPEWTSPAFSHWSVAMNKINLWGFNLFDRIFILDVDIIVLRELTKIIEEAPAIYDIIGGIDGWYGCHDRFRINGGAILIKGSSYLHSAALQMLHYRKASCMSQHWREAEQELLNCLCGFTTSRPERPEFKCHLFPIFNHMFPKNYKCPDAIARPIRMVHFAGPEKPWDASLLNTTNVDLLFWWCIKEAMLPSQSLTNNTKVDHIRALLACKPFSIDPNL